MLRDLRFAFRLYRTNPGFTIVSILLLAIGIGASTLIFSAVDALLLRPLPVRDPESLVRVVETRPVLGTRSDFYPEYLDALLAGSKTLDKVFGQLPVDAALDDGGNPEMIRLHVVTGRFFDSLGVGALLGRNDGSNGDTGGAVLSFPFWQRRYHRDPRVIGRKILIHGFSIAIVGVMPEGFSGTAIDTVPELWIPQNSPFFYPENKNVKTWRQMWGWEIAGRLHPGATLQQARAECIAVYRHATPRTDAGFEPNSIEVQAIGTGVSMLRPKFAASLVFLMAAAVLLLLIVCASTGGLMLARSAARQREMAIRLAVGASTGDVVRQMLAESLLLTATGALAGAAIAFAAMPFLVRALPPVRDLAATILTVAIEVRPDLRILGFCAALCMGSTVLLGLAPALAAARTDVYRSMAVRFQGRWRGRYWLIVLQVALSTALLASAGLLIHTLHNLRSLDAGFDREHIVTFSLDPELLNYTADGTRTLRERLLTETKTLPGVVASGIGGRGLMRGTGVKMTAGLPGQSLPRSEFLNTSLNMITPEYFDALGMRVLSGRNFRAQEPKTNPAHVVVNEAFVRKFFPGVDAVGRTFGSGSIDTVAKPTYVIIGVVSDAKYRSLREPMQPIVYQPEGDDWRSSFILHVRTRGNPEAVIGPVRAVLRKIDPRLPFSEVRTLAEEVDASLWSERVVASLATLFGGFAAVLVVVSIYGLLAWLVAQRSAEIAIRMALGARAENIVRLVSGEALGMVAMGLALGIAGAFAAAPWMRTLLYGTKPSDPGTLAAVACLVLLVTVAATLIPAIRAVRVDPAAALRQE